MSIKCPNCGYVIRTKSDWQPEPKQLPICGDCLVSMTEVK